ncbi:MAG: 7-cyano-7-deazaguanine synthase [Planctomycetota bacterium]
MADAPILFIDRGDMPSLAALAVQADHDRIVLWHLVEPDPAAQQRRAVIDRHARMWGIDHVLITEDPAIGVSGLVVPTGPLDALILVQAAVIAHQIGGRQVIWPRCVGPDGENVAGEMDRAASVCELIEMDGTAGPLDIEAPVIDLTDTQLVDLVQDSGACSGAFWPCVEGDRDPCQQCPECQRWAVAISAMGLSWPWIEADRATAE